MAGEALHCFTSLLEDVPGWIADLENLLEAANARQQEIGFSHQPVVLSRRPVPETVTSSALQLCRSEHDGLPAPLRPAVKQLTNPDALRLSQRKRKTASVASGNQSGPCKFRVKGSAAVYYDGETQKQFEKLVRSIGASRNLIRKGKMSAKVDALSRLGSSCSNSSCDSDDADDDYSQVTARLKGNSTRSGLRVFGRNDGSEAFDRVDGRLEKAQSICECAAHQVLRDGNCSLEVTHAKEHFSEVLKMISVELPALRKRAEKAAERRRRSEEKHRLDVETHAAPHSLHTDSVANAKSPDLAASASMPDDDDIEVDLLEVDDDQSSSDGEELNISSFKFVKGGGRFAPRTRTSRLVPQ